MKKSFIAIPLVLLIFVSFFAFDSKHTAVMHDSNVSKKEYSLLSVLFQQHAAEYRALCIQSYNLARLQLDTKLKSKPSKPAIITDIDETVLDNSPFQAGTILDNTDYNTELWHKWCLEARAEGVPGALEFMKYADSQGVDIYYVSNRDTADLKSTMKNLKDKGFPQCTPEHFSFKNVKSSSKKSRQELIASKHKVLLLLGDNLNDFSHVFEHRNIESRKQVVDSLKSDFGDRFIVIPNAMYGDWESAMYNYNMKMDDHSKDAIRKSLLKR